MDDREFDSEVPGVYRINGLPPLLRPTV